jgi:hypothetical protein
VRGFNESVATLMAELSTEGVLMTANWASKFCLKRLTAFAAELHALRIISLTLRALHQAYPPTDLKSMTEAQECQDPWNCTR